MAGEAWEAPPLSMWDPLLGTPALFRSVQSRYSPRAEVYRYRFVGMKNGRPIYGCKQTSLGDEACFVYFDHDKWVHTSGSLNGSEIVYQMGRTYESSFIQCVPGADPNFPPCYAADDPRPFPTIKFQRDPKFTKALKSLIRWTPKSHPHFPASARRWIVIVLLCSRKRAILDFERGAKEVNARGYCPGLPTEMWRAILQWCSLRDMMGGIIQPHHHHLAEFQSSQSAPPPVMPWDAIFGGIE